MATNFTHKKRRQSADEPPPDEGIELQDLREQQALRLESDALHSSFDATGVPRMNVAGDRQRLAIQLWEGDYSGSMAQLREQNAVLDLLRPARPAVCPHPGLKTAFWFIRTE